MAATSQMMLAPEPTFPQQQGFISRMTDTIGSPVSFTLFSDGRMGHSGDNPRCAPRWINPGAVGIGVSYWGRIDRVSGSGGNDGVNNATAAQLNVNRSWIQNPGGNGVFNFRIARDAAMTDVVTLVNNFTFSAS